MSHWDLRLPSNRALQEVPRHPPARGEAKRTPFPTGARKEPPLPWLRWPQGVVLFRPAWNEPALITWKEAMTIFSAALVLLLAQAPPQVKAGPNDYPGWSDTRWGMSEDEVLAAVSNLQPKKLTEPRKGKAQYKGLVATLEIERLKAFDFTFHVLFWSRDAKLDQVELEAQGIKGLSYRELRTIMVQKYGAPVVDMDHSGQGSANVSITTEWTFPSTKILLLVTPGFMFPTTRLIYRAPPKDLGLL